MKSRSRLVMGRRLPLLGITYDSKDDLLEIALEGLDHLINKPLAISVDDDPEGLIGMEIVDSEGRRHILKLTDPLRRPANSKADSIRREAAMNKMNAIL